MDPARSRFVEPSYFVTESFDKKGKYKGKNKGSYSADQQSDCVRKFDGNKQ
jgi:hypothetical protein